MLQVNLRKDEPVSGKKTPKNLDADEAFNPQACLMEGNCLSDEAS